MSVYLKTVCIPNYVCLMEIFIWYFDSPRAHCRQSDMEVSEENYSCILIFRKYIGSYSLSSSTSAAPDPLKDDEVMLVTKSIVQTGM